jgi:hypothetical protein
MPSWERPFFVGGVRVTDELAETDLSWLCGCGLFTPYIGSKAYPLCTGCGHRMRILNHVRLGYVTAGFPPETA